jgi:hypothetical protein
VGFHELPQGEGFDEVGDLVHRVNTCRRSSSDKGN